MKPTNLLVAILGGAFGIAHLGMIGMIWNSKKLPVINPPVGDYC